MASMVPRENDTIVGGPETVQHRTDILRQAECEAAFHTIREEGSWRRCVERVMLKFDNISTSQQPQLKQYLLHY
jgi:hypothetical protein